MSLEGSFLEKKFSTLLNEKKYWPLSGLNALGLSNNWFWQVRLVAYRFYWLEASSKGFFLEKVFYFIILEKMLALV